ncbi:MAG UNVERIFIED_CONTAM: hypothetical protein LVR18_17025 [Planctomycetaceae bacterium]
MQASVTQSDSQGVWNVSAAAPIAVIMDAPSDGKPAPASRTIDVIAINSNCSNC